MSQNIDLILSRMTLREKIGQTAVLNGSGDAGALSRVVNLVKERKVPDYLKKYPYGGVFVGAEALQDGDATKRREGMPSHLKNFIKMFRENLKYPPVICADAENGCGSVVQGKTLLPKLMALAATRPPR